MHSQRRWSCSVCHKTFLHEFQVLCHFKHRRSLCYKSPGIVALGPSLQRKSLYARRGEPIREADLVHLHSQAEQASDNPDNAAEATTDDTAGSHSLHGRSQLVKEPYLGASKIFQSGKSFMDNFDVDPYTSRRQVNIFYPFDNEDEYRMGSFLLRCGMSMASIDEFFKLQLVSNVFLCDNRPS